MNVLVIGGNSALAQHLIPKLMLFAEVAIATRHGGAPHRVDLAAPRDTWALPPGIDTVVNLSANFGGRDAGGLEAAQAVNARGVLQLVEYCQCAGIKHLVHISSIFSTLDESSQFYSAYSLSKRQGEELARLACRNSSLALTILRPGQLYGPVQRFKHLQPFFYTILTRAATNQDIVFHGQHDALRNFIHADDVAEVIARCVALEVRGEFACIAQKNLSYGQIAHIAIHVLGSRSLVRFDPSHPNITDNDFAADDRLYRELNYFPSISMEDGIAGLVAELKEWNEMP